MSSTFLKFIFKKKLYLLNIAFVIIVITAVVIINDLTTSVQERQTPQIESMSYILKEVTLAHENFEDWVETNGQTELKPMYERIDNALWYANALLNGGKKGDYIIRPFKDKHIRTSLERMIVDVEDFKDLKFSIIDKKKSSINYLEIDDNLDEDFKDLINQIYRIEKLIRIIKNKNLTQSKQLQIILIVFIIIFAVLVNMALYHFDRQREEHLSEIAKKNEMKNQFLGMAAHDLRNPLNVIQGFSSFLIVVERDKLNPEHISFIERIKYNSDKMLMIINDLLDISTIEQGNIALNKTSVDMKTLFDLNEYSSKLIAAKKGINIEVEADKNLPEIYMDFYRMTQVIENLLSNAIKYSYPDTTILLKAEKKEHHVLISVIDQGKGIPPEDLDRIFKPFETSVEPTGNEKSTGLGLVIVKKIVELHQGTISVSSIVNEGSTFTIELPVSEQ